MHEEGTGNADNATLSPFLRYTREEWCRLCRAAPLSLSETEARGLQQTVEHASLEEMSEVYLPL